jgi:hypothetical protein
MSKSTRNNSPGPFLPRRRDLDLIFLQYPYRDRKGFLDHLGPLPLTNTILLCAAGAATEYAAPIIIQHQKTVQERGGEETPLDLEALSLALEPMSTPEGAFRVLWKPVLKEVSKTSLKWSIQSFFSSLYNEAHLGARFFRETDKAAREAARIRAEDDDRLASTGSGRSYSSNYSSTFQRSESLPLSFSSRASVAYHIMVNVAPYSSLSSNAATLLVEYADLILSACERFHRRSRLIAEARGASSNIGSNSSLQWQSDLVIPGLSSLVSNVVLTIPGAQPFVSRMSSIFPAARPVVALAELEREEAKLIPLDPQSPSSLLVNDLIVKRAGGDATSRAKVRSAQSLYNALIVDARLHADLLRVLIRASAAIVFESTGAGLGTLLLPGSGTGLFMALGNLAAWLAI